MRTDVIAPEQVPVVILAGGRGTRLMEETRSIPKPMVTIGENPILFHIMRYYAFYGFREFIICLGYKGYMIKEFFLNFPKLTCDLIVLGAEHQYQHRSTSIQEWKICLAETGEQNLTATRLHRVRHYIETPHFALTYGDGLSDVALDRELEFHVRHGKIGTVAAVHPPARFGNLTIGNDHEVIEFKEKEKLSHDFINGGFFFFRREFLERLSSTEDQSLEAEPLTALARDRQLNAYKHEGFWQCMDTLRDRQYLCELFELGKAPWVVW
jgi:glucose-1-phosphate cytidylyltransferase